MSSVYGNFKTKWLFNLIISRHQMTVYEVIDKEIKELAWYKKPCMIGVDEAGRGPVLGPMVYGIAVSTISSSAELEGRDFADSKVLNAEKRDELFEELCSDETICCIVDEIGASKISGLMLAPEKEVYVDTVGPASAYQERLSRRFHGIKFTVKPKADALYPIVSAASIAAKVWRDRSLGKLGGERGSGYPSDPKTKEWLSKSVDPVFGFDDSVRFSWGTAEKVLGKGAVAVAWECDQEEQQKLTFAKSESLKRHSYFNSRRLKKAKF